jgi:TPR repeat protein
MYNLGHCCQTGEGGVAQNQAEAIRLWQLAASHGFAPAQFNLGSSLRNPAWGSTSSAVT